MKQFCASLSAILCRFIFCFSRLLRFLSPSLSFSPHSVNCLIVRVFSSLSTLFSHSFLDVSLWKPKMHSFWLCRSIFWHLFNYSFPLATSENIHENSCSQVDNTTSFLCFIFTFHAKEGKSNHQRQRKAQISSRFIVLRATKFKRNSWEKCAVECPWIVCVKRVHMQIIYSLIRETFRAARNDI